MNAPFASVEQAATCSSAQMLPPLSERREVRKAVILAAGRGRRMGKLTADRPKGAIEVGGHALIDWQIEALRAAGIKEIAIVTGHGAAALAGRDVAYIHNVNWATGTQVETLLAASDWIGEEPVIVSYSDIIYHPCVPLALLERPGDIVVAYDADHRWLWKRRFGNWLKDSETFRLGPGQVLTEIGGKPTDIEALDGQFMGVMLLTPTGLEQFAQRFRNAHPSARTKLDVTALLSALLGGGVRIDTAANALPWIEIDSTKDLKIARSMTEKDEITGSGPHLIFPANLPIDFTADAFDGLAELDELGGDADGGPTDPQKSEPWREQHLRPYLAIRDHVVENAFAVQNWGRSGSTFVQSLFDDHPQVLSTPNFYSRHYFMAWANTIGRLADHEKIDAFLRIFRQWWDQGLVDATAGLHRLGPERREIAGVDRGKLEGYLHAALADDKPITRRRLFEAAHMAYAMARGQQLADWGLQILFPVHGEPRAVAAALLEDFPLAQFIHTLRDPGDNVASLVRHLRFNALDDREDAFSASIRLLFMREGARSGRRHTIFSDRPYFDWLANSEQARTLRLEDLHRGGSQAIGEVAGKLGLHYARELISSTWDGKQWWNRPETGVQSDLGHPPRQRFFEDDFSARDRRKIDVIAQCVSAGAMQYESRAGSRTIGARLWLFLRLLLPWRVEWCLSPAYAQRLLSISKFPVLPSRVRFQISTRLRREMRKSTLTRLNAGTLLIRRRLPDESKSATIRGTIILSERNDKTRARAIAYVGKDKLSGSDRIDAVYLDDALQCTSAKEHVVWALILFVGGLAARCRASVLIRRLMCRACIQPAQESMMEDLIDPK